MPIESDEVVKSVGRVFEVLELFEQRRERLTATTVERALGYPQSSTLALLKSMVRLGYLSFDRLDRTYAPTMRVALLGNWVESAFHSGGRLTALLHDLADTTSETICLSVPNDLHMQFTHVRVGSQALVLSVSPGALAPMFRSAIGLVALGGRDEADIREMAVRLNRRTRGRTPKIEIESTLAQIRRIRATGHAVGYDLYLVGVGAIAWLLKPDSTGRPIVLSIGGPTERIRMRESALIRAGRQAIRQHLGT
jgi:IclR family KDG regulon transcriptional repressor